MARLEIEEKLTALDGRLVRVLIGSFNRTDGSAIARYSITLPSETETAGHFVGYDLRAEVRSFLQAERDAPWMRE